MIKGQRPPEQDEALVLHDARKSHAKAVQRQEKAGDHRRARRQPAARRQHQRRDGQQPRQGERQARRRLVQQPIQPPGRQRDEDLHRPFLVAQELGVVAEHGRRRALQDDALVPLELLGAHIWQAEQRRQQQHGGDGQQEPPVCGRRLSLLLPGRQREGQQRQQGRPRRQRRA